MSENENDSNEINQDPKTETKKKPPINWGKEIVSWGLVVVTAFALAMIVTRFVIVKAEVPSGSMHQTIMTNDRIIGNRLAYLFTDPKRGDIIIFKWPDNETENYVKRIIGLPGETINIIDGKVYINDNIEPLDEPYLSEEMVGSFGPYIVPENCYFMMGDNRKISLDSRSWDHKYVNKKKILGKVWFRYKPSLGFIK